MTKKVLVFGGVGIGTTIAMAVIDAYRNGAQGHEFVGFVNDKEESIDGFPVFGGRTDIPKLITQGYSIINTVYKLDGQVERVRLFESLKIPDEALAIFVHPRSYVAPNVTLGPGCVVLPNSNVSSYVSLGRCVRVMTGAMVGHDCVVGDHAFFAANSCVGSRIQFGVAAYCGLNCTVGGNLSLGDYCVAGMGSVVTKDVKDYEVVGGNPARPLRFVKDKPA